MRLRDRAICRQRGIAWQALRVVGVEERAREWIPQGSVWDRLFSMCDREAYRPIVIEFLTTFCFSPHVAGEEQDGSEISFKVFEQETRLSLDGWATFTGLYESDELVHDHYTIAIDGLDFDELFAWWPTIGGETSGVAGAKERFAKASEIRDPLIRYLHRCLKYSITARSQSNEKVTQIDLFFLYCIFRPRPCALHRCLTELFSSIVYKPENSVIACGGIICALAQRAGGARFMEATIEPEIFLGRFMPHNPLDLAAMRNMKLAEKTKDVPPRHYLVSAKGEPEFVPQPLVHRGIQGGHGEVEMVDVAEPDEEGGVEVEIPMPEADPQAQQHPRRVFRSLRMSASVMEQIWTITDEAQASRQWREGVDQWRTQIDQTLSMLVASENERRAAVGLGTLLRPGAGTHAGTSSQEAGTSSQQPPLDDTTQQ